MNSVRAKLQELHFHNPRLSKVAVEALTLKELRRRVPDSELSAPQRVEFHHLLLVREGHAKHMVDFVECDLSPGSVLLVSPGQVHQWHMREGLQGDLALISADALAPRVARSDVDMGLLSLNDWPSVSTPSQGLFMEALADIVRLRESTERFGGTDVEAAIIRHELLTLLLRLARELRQPRAARADTREAEIHRLFAKELEHGFSKSRSVLNYAKHLGYSESTLSRACMATVGHTAKAEIDNRTALEAKRLLVHSNASCAEIGHQLGFSEPTNFAKFFKRNVSHTPSEFRQMHRD